MGDVVTAEAGTRALLCECAGTMARNVDFDALERGLGAGGVTVERRAMWCGREANGRLIELLELGEAAGRLLLVGCSPDFAARRLQGVRHRSPARCAPRLWHGRRS